MKRQIIVLITMAILYILPEAGFALSDDPFKKDTDSYFKINLMTEYYQFDNSDFLAYDYGVYQYNQSNQNLNTDDAINFMYSTVEFKLKKSFKSSVFVLEMYRSGFWGNDNLEGKDNGGNSILFSYAYFKLFITDGFNLTFGRQRFGLGHTLKELYFYDIVDGITFNISLADSMHLTVLVDILGIAAKPDTYLFSSIATDDEEIEDFNGNTTSFRVGVVFNYASSKTFGFKVFAFYVKYGANTDGGADRAQSGNNEVNQADNDYLINGGARFYLGEYNIGGKKIKIDITGAFSYGRDYQYTTRRDYRDFAAWFNIKLIVNRTFNFLFTGAYFGEKYCNMKALSMGGLLLYANKGYFPAPYVSAYHFKDYDKYDPPKSYDKTNSKIFGYIELNINVKGWKFTISALPLMQTKDFAYMGTEAQVKIYGKLFENLTLSFQGGLYIPSNYYVERCNDNTYLPAGDEIFWGVGVTLSYAFDLFSGKNSSSGSSGSKKAGGVEIPPEDTSSGKAGIPTIVR